MDDFILGLIESTKELGHHLYLNLFGQKHYKTLHLELKKVIKYLEETAIRMVVKIFIESQALKLETIKKTRLSMKPQ